MKTASHKDNVCVLILGAGKKSWLQLIPKRTDGMGCQIKRGELWALQQKMIRIPRFRSKEFIDILTSEGTGGCSNVKFRVTAGQLCRCVLCYKGNCCSRSACEPSVGPLTRKVQTGFSVLWQIVLMCFHIPDGCWQGFLLNEFTVQTCWQWSGKERTVRCWWLLLDTHWHLARSSQGSSSLNEFACKSRGQFLRDACIEKKRVPDTLD